MLEVGDSAPEFKVQTHRGEFVSLSDFIGKTVVLWFYPKADTPGCTAEACGFRDLNAEFAKKKAVLLGVSLDDVGANRAFAEKYHLPFTLLSDVNRDISLAYGAVQSDADEYARRIAYVIDPRGMVQKTYPKVDAKAFPDQVLREIG